MDNIRKIEKGDFWDQTSLKNKIEFVLQYAVLAPSSHNCQPWLFEVREGSLRLKWNPEINLPHSDKEGRDRFISVGCALENLIIASKYFKIFDNFEIVVKEEENLAAEIFFKENLNREVDRNYEDLIEAILKRANTRGEFKDKPVEKYILEDIEKSLRRDEYFKDDIEVKFLIDHSKIERIAEFTSEGLKIAHNDRKFRKEASKWIINNLSKRKDGMPGYSLKIPTVISFFAPLGVRLVNAGSVLGKLSYKSVSSAPLVCILSSKKDNREDWLKIGSLSERLMLEFRARGIFSSVYVASIEMGDLRKKVAEVLDSDMNPQFVFAAGYMDYKGKLVSRYPAKSKIIQNEQ